MKKINLFFIVFITSIGFSQSTKPTNVYPSNLEENMYFKGYDASSQSITGLHFLVLSDGDNSKDKTPAFEVTLYLMPEGKSSIEDLIVVKKYSLDGIFHMGSHEYKNEVVNLSGIDIALGRYRLGIWVNSSASFEEDTNDNATLFNNTIVVSTNPASAEPQTKTEKQENKKSSEEEWNTWEEDDDSIQH